MPPSHVVALAPRSGVVAAAARPPREPLSLVKTTIVSLVEPERGQLVEDDIGRPVDGLDRGAVRPVARRVGEALLHVDREVDVHVGEVQEERVVAGVAEEAHGLGDVALGERRLVGLLLEHARRRASVAAG